MAMNLATNGGLSPLNNGTSNPHDSDGTMLLSTSSSSSAGVGSGNNNKGRLRMTIVSANDMPDREPPLYVQLDILVNDGTNTSSQTANILRSVRTGPPMQQHKDRNSFKFHSFKGAGSGGGGVSTKTTTTSRGKVTVETQTLAELYQSTALLTVVYNNHVKPQYTVSYPLNQLLIHESTWLILKLSSSSSSTSPATTTTTTGRLNGSALVEQQQQQQLAKMSGTGQETIDNQHNEDDDDEQPPTLRVQMTLEGPYRPEIGAMVRLTQKWTSFVDHVDDRLLQFSSMFPSIPVQWILVPSVPILTGVVVISPVVIGILMLFLPFILPLVVIVVVAVSGLLGIGGIWYVSGRTGRGQVITFSRPVIYQTMINTRAGQEWIYQTGPRPTPVHLLRSTTLIPTGAWNKLLLSLLIDLMGSASYLIPVAGEGLDLVWAPLQTVLVMAMYCPDNSSNSINSNGETITSTSTDISSSVAAMGTAALPFVSFIEEILPFTDVVPSATLGWLGQFAYPLLVRRADVDASPPPVTALTRIKKE